MQSTEHHYCLVVQQVGLLLGWDLVRHLGSRQCHQERYSAASAAHWMDVVGDQELGLGARSVVRVALFLVWDCQSLLADVDLDAVALDAVQKGVT